MIQVPKDVEVEKPLEEILVPNWLFKLEDEQSVGEKKKKVAKLANGGSKGSVVGEDVKPTWWKKRLYKLYLAVKAKTGPDDIIRIEFGSDLVAWHLEGHSCRFDPVNYLFESSYMYDILGIRSAVVIYPEIAQSSDNQLPIDLTTILDEREAGRTDAIDRHVRGCRLTRLRRARKLWFPSRFFSLNATFLTLLSVALKLPVDLTTNMTATTDRLAKIRSLALMSTAIANFVPSLGSMTDPDILINAAALTILILTVVADVCIQIVGTRSVLDHRALLPEEILMLILLLVLLSTSLMPLTAKKCLETKYLESSHREDEEEEEEEEAAAIDKLKKLVKKYWVMAETSSSQFVIARWRDLERGKNAIRMRIKLYGMITEPVGSVSILSLPLNHCSLALALSSLPK
ncbi:hypothetical protein SASPL_133583 [Salvia splendens]|uniref:Uncharacterized protein n=1 Tax=Salvia splendens TaxID=180675 RepID=A0A8X8ZI88_SALSN|nr:hypothetical protein SASPL_133583 [Salvia splendens]